LELLGLELADELLVEGKLLGREIELLGGVFMYGE
jgi:hypothetical protein